MKIKIKDCQKIARIKPGRIRKLMRRALKLEGMTQAEISILFLDDQKIRELNRRYRETDEATDVLAFSQKEGSHSQVNPNLLGDIVISVERARAQSKGFGQTLDKEISLYLVHGLLHLLGYDDVDQSHQARMEKKQQEILKRTGETRQ